MSNFILAWLTSRIDRLYAVNGSEHAKDVLAAEQEIFDKGKNIFEGLTNESGTFAEDLANISTALKGSLDAASGMGSVAGRIARMELAHTVEGVRHLVALMSPAVFEKIAGPTLTPVMMRTDPNPSAMMRTNADPLTSTPGAAGGRYATQTEGAAYAIQKAAAESALPGSEGVEPAAANTSVPTSTGKYTLAARKPGTLDGVTAKTATARPSPVADAPLLDEPGPEVDPTPPVPTPAAEEPKPHVEA